MQSPNVALQARQERLQKDLINSAHNPYIFVENNAIVRFDVWGLATLIKDGGFSQSIIDDIQRQMNAACGKNFDKYVEKCGKYASCIGKKCSSAKVHLQDGTPWNVNHTGRVLVPYRKNAVQDGQEILRG
jgi:hypothetical protein